RQMWQRRYWSCSDQVMASTVVTSRNQLEIAPVYSGTLPVKVRSAWRVPSREATKHVATRRKVLAVKKSHQAPLSRKPTWMFGETDRVRRSASMATLAIKATSEKRR